jgi:hypothetical protein
MLRLAHAVTLAQEQIHDELPRTPTLRCDHGGAAGGNAHLCSTLDRAMVATSSPCQAEHSLRLDAAAKAAAV